MSPQNQQNLEEMMPDEYMEALEKAKRLSKAQKAGKTIKYLDVKVKKLSKLPRTKEEDQVVSERLAQEKEAGAHGLEDKLKQGLGIDQLDQKEIDELTPEQKMKAKGMLAEPENLEELMTRPQDYSAPERQESESEEDFKKRQDVYKFRQMGQLRRLEEIKKEQPEQAKNIEEAVGKPIFQGQADSPQQMLERSGMYSEDRKERKEQKEAGERQIKDDYGKESWDARRRGGAVGEPGRGKNLAGKTAGKTIGAIAEHGGAVSAGLIYGLALLNDFPDLASSIINFFTIGTGAIINFLFDVVVFLGFRYFLRDHMNVPGVKAALYIFGALELLPGIVISIDILPFWTICAWLVLRKINQEKAGQVGEQSQNQEPGWIPVAEGEQK
jgi:hypothetical protein